MQTTLSTHAGYFFMGLLLSTGLAWETSPKANLGFRELRHKQLSFFLSGGGFFRQAWPYSPRPTGL